ncbi:DUF4260 domain-containing protein [Rossellomorea aquimaris]|nr:DUF4260 domain-containing protein [Rossellomorea aquimaris]
MNKWLLRIEGLCVFLLSIYVYGTNDFSWPLFLLLLFTPDVGMIGYVFNHERGAVVYNAFHTYSLPLGLLVLASILEIQWIFLYSLIWTAHIGMDRMLGYGLKYPTHFKDTHLNRM